MLSTHWRIGWWGKTSSTNKAALSAILRAPQLGAEAASLTAKRDQLLVVAGFTLNPEKTVFKSSAFQILIKFFYDVCR